MKSDQPFVYHLWTLSPRSIQDPFAKRKKLHSKSLDLRLHARNCCNWVSLLWVSRLSAWVLAPFQVLVWNENLSLHPEQQPIHCDSAAWDFWQRLWLKSNSDSSFFDARSRCKTFSQQAQNTAMLLDFIWGQGESPSKTHGRCILKISNAPKQLFCSHLASGKCILHCMVAFHQESSSLANSMNLSHSSIIWSPVL